MMGILTNAFTPLPLGLIHAEKMYLFAFKSLLNLKASSNLSKSKIASPEPCFKASFFLTLNVPQNVTPGKEFFNSFFLSGFISERNLFIIFS